MERKLKLFVLVLAAVLLTSCLTVAVPVVKADATPRTITVPDDFASIQDAVRNATAGDTVYVRKGNYSIPPRYQYGMEIGKSVTLIGENPQNTIIETTEIHFGIFGWSYGIALYDDSEISGFTITGNVNVIFLIGNGRIVNNIINLTADGRYAIAVGSGTISSNIINCVEQSSSSRGPGSGTIGIGTGTTANTTIYNNIINGFGIGIESISNRFKILNNTFTNNAIGIFIQCSPALLRGNNFESSNGCGLRANGGTNATCNWWGTNDTKKVSNIAITTTGYDQDVYGKVIFEPFLTEPNPQAIPVKSTVEPSPSSSTEPFPITLVAVASGASIAVVAAGVVVYWKKRKPNLTQ
jgi:hypothetical protein